MDDGDKPKAYVCGMLDTGAGLNIGFLDFWLDFAKKRPDLVKACAAIDFGNYDKIHVGGINKNALASTCTHFIELYTPLRENGRQVTLRIGLCKDFSANLIFGLPFQVRSRMVIHVAEGFVHSQAFQREFPIQYMAPIRRLTVPEQGDGLDVQTYASMTGNETVLIPSPPLLPPGE